jgi:hypothetical protein
MIPMVIFFIILQNESKFITFILIIVDNGRIDQKEMEKILIAIYDLKGIKEREGPNSPKAKTAEIFAKMDTNFSNTLDEQEFIKGCMNDQQLRSFLIEN